MTSELDTRYPDRVTFWGHIYSNGRKTRLVFNNTFDVVIYAKFQWLHTPHYIGVLRAGKKPFEKIGRLKKKRSSKAWKTLYKEFWWWQFQSGNSDANLELIYLICNLNMISHKHMPALVLHHVLMNFLPHSSSMKYPVCYLCNVSRVPCLKNLWLPETNKRALHEVDQITHSGQKRN